MDPDTEQNRIPVIFSSAEDSERNSVSSFYFCSPEWNSKLFSLPRKGSERNSESFLFCRTAGIPSEIPIDMAIPSSVELCFVGNFQP